jgi:hypothetical protein
MKRIISFDPAPPAAGLNPEPVGLGFDISKELIS